MVPRPIATALTTCDYVIVEEKTKKVSLIGGFTIIRHDYFPSPTTPFCVYAAFTDGLGEGKMNLVISRLDDGREIHGQEERVIFPDRLTLVQALFRIGRCSFPAPGSYDVTLLIDNEWMAQRRLQVLKKEIHQ